MKDPLAAEVLKPLWFKSPSWPDGGTMSVTLMYPVSHREGLLLP